MAMLPFLEIKGANQSVFKDTGTFRHHPSIQIELVVAEPDVVDPVALCFDAAGIMYVVEMRDYPYGKGPTGSPGGTIRQLVFDDAGHLKESHLFAENLSFPTSIAPHKGGVLVAAKDLIFLQDTDGDHVADVRQTILTGFNQSVTDSNFNGLRWGLDNSLHGVNGGNNGNIHSPRRSEKSLPLRGADFAWNPLNDHVRRTFHTGGGFGLVFDAYGSSFTTHNINHILQRILPVEAMERFRGFPSMRATVHISDHGGMARIYPISETQTRVNHPEQSGYFSSSGGMGIIPDTFDQTTLAGGVLVCDVVGNLVHRDVMHPNGPVFEARRAAEELSQEFLASRDLSFRPVGMETGPDGNLYLLDMQRAVIEHPDYIPEKIKGRYQIREGEDRGRIYRVSPADSVPVEWKRLNSLTSEELIDELGHPNHWIRMTAQRLIVERQDLPKRSSFKNSLKSSNPFSRLHALWSMQGTGLLRPKDIRAGLADSNPGIRTQTLLMLESRPEWWNQLWPSVQALSLDPDPKVRFQAALTLGRHPHPDNAQALTRILETDLDHVWSRRSVLTSLRENPIQLLRHMWRAYPIEARHPASWEACLSEIAYIAGARLEPQTSKGLADFLSSLSANDAANKRDGLVALLTGLKNGVARVDLTTSIRNELRKPLQALAKAPTLKEKRAVWALSKTMNYSELPGFENALHSSLSIAANSERKLQDRLEAIELLGLGNFDDSGKTLLSLLNGLEPLSIQESSLEQLGKYSEEEVALGILNQWREIGPGLRPSTINILLRRRAFHLPLIEAIENGQIGLGELNLDLEQRRLLREYSSIEVKEKAAKLFGDEEYSNRKELLDAWMDQMPPQGDLSRGRLLFGEHCAQCHQSGDLGVNVGPNLTDMSHRSVEDLAFNILDPNMAINPAFVAYEAETHDGELISGIISSESPEAVTILSAQGIRREFSRSNLQYLRSGGLSLMPEGLEEQLTPAELRDLISFLQQKP